MITDKPIGHPGAIKELRRQAEEALRVKKMNVQPHYSDADMQRIIHELEVHQIELEMQNEVLLQARDEVENTLEKYTDLYDFAPVGYVSLDHDGRVTAVNLAGASLLAAERSQLINRNFEQFVTIDDRPGFTDFLVAVLVSQVKESCEVTLASNTNTPVVVQIEAMIVAAGQEFRLAMIDITRRRQIEDTLREREEQMYQMAEMAIDAIVMLDDRGMVTSCNAATEKIFGYPAAEMNGKDFHRLFIPERFLGDARLGFEQFRTQGTGPLIGTTTEFVALRRNGSEFPLEISVSALTIKGKWHAIAIMRDVSERKQLESKIQDAREYAENIVETVRRPLVVLDWQLMILTANRSFYHTFKVISDETIGKCIYDLGNKQWDIPRLRTLLAEILQHDTGFNDYEVEHDFPGIGHKTILLNARQIYQKNSDSRIILLSMEDITARKQLETEIQDAREYAENIVETVREPLVVLNSDLKILTANHSFYETFKVTPEATIGNFIYDLGNRQWDIPKLRILIEDILPLSTVFNGYEVEHDFVGIGRKIIRLNAREVYRKDIGSRVILLAMEDITVRKLAEERIGEVIRQQQAILDNIPNSAWLKDKHGRYLAVNEPFGRAFGVAPKDLVGKNDYDIYPRERAMKYEKNLREVMETGTRTYFEESIVDREGRIRYVEKIKTPIFNDAGAVIGIIGIVHDITNRKEVEVSLRHDSTHDILTGLYNRAFFNEELERFRHKRMFPLSIVMADLNSLKTVNDTRGHGAGDDLIRLAGQILLRVFRGEDIVARIGGDEFAILLPNTDSCVAEETVGRIMSSPEVIDGRISIAFGIATAKNADQLAAALQLSDQRMYQDKSAYKESGELTACSVRPVS